MVEITLPITLQIIQTLSLIIGVAYYITIMRNSQRTRELALQSQEQALETRQAQLFMQIFARQYDIEQRRSHYLIRALEYEDVDDFIEKYGPENNPDADLRLRTLGAYYEGIGVLVKRNLIDPSMVDDLMSGRIIDFWQAIRRFALDVRERTGDYEAFEHSEYLYDVIKSIQDKQRIAAGLPTR
jgi:hypothetical protein